MIFTASCHANFSIGIEKTGQAEDFQAPARIEIMAAVLKRRALYGDKEVDRDGIGPYFSDGHQEVHDIVICLPLAHYASRADFQPGSPASGYSVNPVLIGMGGTDLGVKALARIEVVIDPVEPCRPEALGLLFTQKSQRAAYRDSHLLLNGPDNIAESFNLLVGWIPAA